MSDQLSFASLDFAAKKKRTKRDLFLGEMSAVVPWGMLEALIEPHYPKMGPQGGRRPFPLGTMLRIYCKRCSALTLTDQVGILAWAQGMRSSIFDAGQPLTSFVSVS